MKNYDKRLYRSKDNKVLAGVIGGLGEYFEIDPVLLRVAYIIISVFTGFFPGIIAYVFMAMVVPKNSEVAKENPETK